MYGVKLMPLSNAAPPEVDTRTRSWPALFLLGAVALVGCADQPRIAGPVETEVLVAGAPSAALHAQEVTTIDYPGALHTRLYEITAAGEIAGTYVVPGPPPNTHGFVLDRDGFRTVDAPFPGVVATQVQGMNAAGDVVGVYTPGPHAFLLTRGGTFHAITQPGVVSSTALGINAAGDIVGNQRAQDGVFRGYLLSRGTFHIFEVPGATLTVASDINEQGEIVGRYQTPAHGPFYSMFLRSRNGDFTTINVPGALSTGLAGTLAGINPRGEIVGPFIGADGKTRGFLLNASGYHTIDFPDTQFVIAGSINPQGDIVGHYRDLAGRDRGFLLRR
jgi:hypothetical protein